MKIFVKKELGGGGEGNKDVQRKHIPAKPSYLYWLLEPFVAVVVWSIPHLYQN